MNKTELITAISDMVGVSKKDTEMVLSGFIRTVEKTLAKGDKVALVGFGTFEVRDRAARKGRNPQTSIEITIPAAKVPVFKVGKAFRDAINQ